MPELASPLASVNRSGRDAGVGEGASCWSLTSAVGEEYRGPDRVHLARRALQPEKYVMSDKYGVREVLMYDNCGVREERVAVGSISISVLYQSVLEGRRPDARSGLVWCWCRVVAKRLEELARWQGHRPLSHHSLISKVLRQETFVSRDQPGLWLLAWPVAVCGWLVSAVHVSSITVCADDLHRSLCNTIHPPPQLTTSGLCLKFVSAM
ncbi:hypothetical protein C0Q70_04460 [Pomacea canaliculata]|uniref:Uncharacterized protein n=1 Tax=Pomacea canaliculata TaxID=400727 RepID=A0A2T7PIG9_POMCA|nr:hypothetical protein C0Q70_04460 [Pomacea canaliculata]